MWISFSSKARDARFVIRPFIGGINAISGEPLTGDMSSILKRLNSVASSQDYLVIPKQNWLDGVATAPGIIKQFVATPILSQTNQALRTAKKREEKMQSLANPSEKPGEFELGASIELQMTGRDSTGGLQLA